ncbi:cell wall-active antibiotics response protein LiaF [Solibacillus sp. MA9]|uniref:Cell wall-active antibiotics response protein LiaF n=1 Tax=Solibacillus palustris TaxID=2908203 RepID=A0ABS9UAI0_9BACL|nr:cell wall-active antibiotics response protein LiaF [Solibacillus sp. MA9]MCH7321135.1 cell wall-active antibiotics response protein LiaF [Solibacillus sp. MA9]
MPKITTDHLAIIVICFALVVLIELTLFNNGTVFLLIIGAALLYFSFKKKKQYLLWAGLFFLFLAVINIWTLRLLIIGTLIFLLYQYLTKKEQVLEIKKHITSIAQQNQLIGTTNAPTESYQWQDVHIQRFIGDITIDATETILPPGKSLIVIQQSLGKIRIVVPYEVTVQLNYSTLYGQATCFSYAPKQCVNEQLKFDDGPQDAKRILVIYVTTWIGDVEVQRA